MATWFRSFASESVGAASGFAELFNAGIDPLTVVAPATHGRGGSDNMLAINKGSGVDSGFVCGVYPTAAPTAANIEILVEFYPSDVANYPSSIAGVVRAAPANDDGYVSGFNAANDMFLVGLDNSGWFGGASDTASGLTLSASTKYRLRVRANGTTISAKLWEAASAEPGSWTITWTDSTYSSGAVGLSVQKHNNTQDTHITFISVGTDGDSAPDSAASAATLSSPTSASVTQTGATIGATTDDNTGTLYGVVTTSASAPSATQIKAGQDHTGSAAAGSGSNASLSVGANTIAITGLTAATTYYYYLVQDNGSDSNVVNGTFTTAVAAPTLTSPTAVSIGTTTVTPRVTTDTGNGTCYYVITPQAEGEPSNTQVEAGTNAAGGAPVASGSQVVSASGVITFSEVTGLTAGTAYRISYAHSGTPS